MWLVVVLLLVTAWSIRRDARKLRCGVYLLSVIVGLTGAAVVEITASLSQLDHRAGAVFLMAGLVIVLGAVVVLGVALVLNGFQMVRREGHRLQNLLSLLVGLAILGFVAVGAGVVATARVDLIAWFFTGALPVGYLAYGFTAYLLYSLVYRAGVRRWAPPPEAVVVLGAGLVRGRVPPLLASRLDKGQEMLGRAREATPGAIIVASGGQGSDEPRSEAAAMADYLADHGVDPSLVVVEDRSKTTEENLAYSKELLAANGVTGPVAVVTNNFHVLRAALLMRRMEIPGHAWGSPTAGYYRPSATIREYLAILRDHWPFNAVALGVTVLPLIGYAVSR